MIGFIQSTTYNDTGHARRKPHRAGALVRPSTAARLHSICPALPSSLLGDFITRLTPRSLVTLLELLFPIPPYCRRPFVVFFSHIRPIINQCFRFHLIFSYLVNTRFGPGGFSTAPCVDTHVLHGSVPSVCPVYIAFLGVD